MSTPDFESEFDPTLLFDAALANPEELAEAAELRRIVSLAFNSLPGRDRNVLVAWFYHEHTYAEIGHSLGLSGERVRQIKAAALETLRLILKETL